MIMYFNLEVFNMNKEVGKNQMGEIARRIKRLAEHQSEEPKDPKAKELAKRTDRVTKHQSGLGL